ncbi:hypothetical protein RhiirA4_449016 [Rhizophagus irregularis]|uniref:RNase H type-1 domain-containing protein n=1 Tax=Rhizophagus irregularis TaxID=588596 RepID=A0A2I1HEZ0_9GLOM|nr:hypothetical protein RhiirA4_449016 [Rhizophagus irregularis]
MSHWLPPSDPNSVEFIPCPGCSRHVPKYASLSHIKRRCTSESCFTKVLLSDTVAYPTKKNTKVFATGRPIKLATSFAYASSLAQIHFDRISNPVALSSPDVAEADESDYMLPSSTCTLYTDGSFLASRSGSSPSMSSAWLALDDDGLLLESCSEVIPTTYPSAFRSEIYGLLSALKALPPHSSVVVNTDCASLISFWHQFVDKPFIPKLLRQPNYLLWLSVRHYFYTKQLSVTFQKVSAHSENLLNNQVDSLAKDAHFLPQPTFTPIASLEAPCIILYDSLPVEDNIRHFFKSIYEARNLLSFSSLSRFSLLAPVDTFDWEGISFWLSRSKVFTTHNNGHKGLLAFRLKILLDMLPTLTALQKRDPSTYPSDWLCALCHSAPEDLNHLWTCPYIIPDASPRLIFQKLMLSFHDKCITQFSDIFPPSDQFLLEFSALDCWDFTTPSSSCLWLARGLLPAELSSIRSTLNYLVEEVHILKMKQSRNNTTVNRDESVSPEPTVQGQRKVLQDMTIEQFKSFRDEIVQILAGLDDSLSLDHTKPWNEIYKHVSKNIMPAVDKALNGRIWYNPTELKYVLQQLHRHRRENWQISQDDEELKVDKKRKGTNARRSDKKERRKRGFLHMYNTNDPVLLYSQPSSLSDKKYKKDIEELATNGAYHSDEMSETDEEKLKKLLRHADKVGESVQNIKVQRKRWYNDNDYQDCSTPPDGSSNFFGCSVTNRFWTFFRRHFGLISASILWVDIGFDFWGVRLILILGSWTLINISLIPDVELISALILDIGFDSWALGDQFWTCNKISISNFEL